MNPQDIPNHLVKAILVTIFCCLPLGVVSIVFAAQVNSQVQTGNIEEARRLSSQANLWANIGLACGLASILIWFVLMMLGAVGGMANA
jgi:hypothetical protein